jgi:hypothetical protein
MRGTNRDFDGNAGVDAVLVVEIDAIQLEALQAGLTGRSHIRWIATDLSLPIRIDNSELGCQFHPLSHPSLQSLLPKKRNLRINEQTNKQTKKKKKRTRDLSEKDFVGEGAVEVGGVEEGDAGVDGVLYESDHVLFWLGRAIEAGHAQATQALC